MLRVTHAGDFGRRHSLTGTEGGGALPIRRQNLVTTQLKSLLQVMAHVQAERSSH
jgi:hypothetical protein